MKTQIQKPQPVSHTIQSKTKAANQAPLQRILQKYAIQREALPDEDELLQGKFDSQPVIARNEAIPQTPMQGKFDVAQREDLPDEDELLQGKFDTTQLMDLEGEEEPLQAKSENRTGMPDDLKSGIENMSGFSMDDVRVHYNSPKPAQLQALAYTQGTDIQVAPGQEKHLPHEAWHVVQQKQGRVQPTMQLQGVNINDNEGLETEADVMGENAVAQMKTEVNYKTKPIIYTGAKKPLGIELTGVCMSASLDPNEEIRGSEPAPNVHKDLMDALRDDYKYPNMIKGHLLNADLGGLGIENNLFPITSSANANHKTKVENRVKKAVISENHPGDYTVEIDPVTMDASDLDVKLKCSFIDKTDSSNNFNNIEISSTPNKKHSHAHLKGHKFSVPGKSPWLHKGKGYNSAVHKETFESYAIDYEGKGKKFKISRKSKYSDYQKKLKGL